MKTVDPQTDADYRRLILRSEICAHLRDTADKSIRVEGRNPDGTETRSVYDDLGQVIWATETFVPADGEDPGSVANTAFAMHTVYNELGQVTASERYEDVAITLIGIECGSAMVWQSQVAESAGGTLFSDTRMYYDEQGRNIESVDATGLRLGSIFYANGDVEYTGPLTATAPTGGRVTTLADGTSWVGFDLGDFVSYTHYEHNQYDSSLNLFYDRTTDANGHHTDSYKDTLGRSVRTMYDDGSFTETLYSFGGNAITQTMEGETIGQPDETQVSSLSCAGTTATVYTNQPHSFAVGERVRIVGANPSQYNGVFIITAVYSDEWEPEYSYSFSYTVPTGTPAYATGTITAETVVDVLSPTADEGWSSIPAGGKEVVSIAQRKTGDAPIVTFNLYDGAGRLTDVWQPGVSDADPSSSTYNQTIRPHYSYQYDSAGNQLSQLDPTQQYAYKDWQADYQQWQQDHQQWVVAHYWWEQNGQVDPEPVEPTEPEPFADLTCFAYDQNDQQVSRTLPEGEVEWQTYDAHGRVLTRENFKGQMTWYVYDDTASHGDRLVAEYRYTTAFTPSAGQNPESTLFHEKTTYVYDDDASLPSAERQGLGQLVEVREYARQAGVVTLVRTEHFTFDTVTGQLASSALPEGTVHYQYDPVSEEHTRTFTDNNDTTYEYDSQGRLWHVTVTKLNGVTLSTAQVTTYGYDLAGNLLTVAQPNGLLTTYTYDHLNRLTDEVVNNTISGHPVFAQHYTLRNDGLRESVIETRYSADGTMLCQTQTEWTYDDLGRLTDESMTVLAGGANAPAAYANHYRFDLKSNRVRKEIDKDNDSTIDATVTYTYSDNDQLLTETRTGGKPYTILYGHYDGSTFIKGYDANGSLVEKHRTTSDPNPDSSNAPEDAGYVWDMRNRMTRATTNGVVTEYGYDSNGVRISQGKPAGTTYYLNDENNPTGNAKAIEEKSSPTGTPNRSYVLGLKVEGQADTTDGTRYLSTDGHGSTRALVDMDGTVVQKYDYDAFGEAMGFDPATAGTTWLFGGDGVYDPSTGWTCFGSAGIGETGLRR